MYVILQVFYVVMQFYSPFPKAVTISRQTDPSSDYQVWQYYADNCARFNLANNGPYTSPTSINCLQFGTWVSLKALLTKFNLYEWLVS